MYVVAEPTGGGTAERRSRCWEDGNAGIALLPDAGGGGGGGGAGGVCG